MINSMTGFGRGACQYDGREMVIELKSVNHRYLDLNIRLPRALMFIEDKIRQLLQQRFSRGHIDVYVTYNNTRSDSKKVVTDYQLLEAYLEAARESMQKFELEDDLSIVNALRFPEVLSISEAEEDQKEIISLCEKATNIASDSLIAMREAEGKKLCTDILSRINFLSSLADYVEERAPLVVEEYGQKLKDRIEQFLNSVELDESKLANEIAYFADKANITEEIIRLKSHFEQFISMLNSNEPTGRKLDFITQELNREINTIGSKASDTTILAKVIDAKAEIEKIREQVQNIE